MVHQVRNRVRRTPAHRRPLPHQHLRARRPAEPALVDRQHRRRLARAPRRPLFIQPAEDRSEHGPRARVRRGHARRRARGAARGARGALDEPLRGCPDAGD